MYKFANLALVVILVLCLNTSSAPIDSKVPDKIQTIEPTEIHAGRGHAYSNMMVQLISEDGEVQYTRDGSFVKGKDGYLYTKDGWLVGGGIKLPANNYKFTINPNGDVYTYDEAGSLPKRVGTIPLVGFANPERLEQGVNNKMVATDDSGQPELISNHRSFRQNAIETSNVNIYASVNEMLRLNASMIASMRLLKVADDMYNKGINIRE